MMKPETTILEDADFRCLKNEEIDNPLYCIAQLYGKDIYIETFRLEVKDWIKTACSRIDNQFGNPDEYRNTYKHCMMLLELAYVLYSTDISFALDKDHPINRPNNEPFGWYMENKQSMACPELYFRNLSGDEVNDVNVFFDEFFSFMDLTEWYKALDDLLQASLEERSVTDLPDMGHRIIEINEYLEKLIEAIAVVYETKGVLYSAQQEVHC